MTNRIDRLEELGLVARERDPEDRRGVLIRLTTEGRKLVDEAIAVRLEDGHRNLSPFSKAEEKTLAGLLRRLLMTMDDRWSMERRENGGSYATEKQEPTLSGSQNRTAGSPESSA